MNRQLFARVRMLLLVAVLAVPLSAQNVTVNVTQEGGLWDALEAQGITDFAQVKNLTITGTMGDIDFSLIKNQMSNLESVDLSGIDLKEIHEGTFANKEHLKTARLPEGVTTIKGQTFNNCQLLENDGFFLAHPGSSHPDIGKALTINHRGACVHFDIYTIPRQPPVRKGHLRTSFWISLFFPQLPFPNSA